MRTHACCAQLARLWQSAQLHPRQNSRLPEDERLNPGIGVTPCRAGVIPLAKPLALFRLVAAVIGRGLGAIFRCRRRHLNLCRRDVRHHPERRLKASQDDRKCDKRDQHTTDHDTIVHLKPAFVMALQVVTQRVLLRKQVPVNDLQALAPFHHRNTRGPKMAPTNPHRRIAAAYQTAMKENESSVQCSA